MDHLKNQKSIIPESILALEKQLKSQKYNGNLIENLDQISYVGGIDISYPVENPESNPSVVVYSILNLNSMKIVYSKHQETEPGQQLPYIAGFLGAKEASMMSSLINQVHSQKGEFDDFSLEWLPQVILIDGNGLLHSRRFGSACYIHKLCNIPTIGVAKNLLHVEGITPKPTDLSFKEKCRTELSNFGDHFIYKDEKQQLEIVAVTKSSKQKGPCTKPIFISLGGGVVGLKLAVEIVLKTCISKIPQPIRIADLQGRNWLKSKELGNFEN